MSALVGVLAAVLLLLLPGRGAAEIQLPPGFTAHVYVTGEGFDASQDRGRRGIPAVSTLTIDPAGVLYLARSGRRYFAGGEIDDVWPIYRIPVGGATLTPQSERRYFHGPPLPSPQIGAVRGERELFVTTFNRDRKLGVLYRIVDGRAELFAGGTPDPGVAPLLKQPEGVSVDGGGIYVADRTQDVVVRLDPAGRVADARYLEVRRPRVVVPDGEGGLWVGADGNAEAPWQQGVGEIWHVNPNGAPRLVLRGPIPQAIARSPGGNLLVADRHASQVFIVTPDGARRDFIRFTDGDAPRSLAVAPVTPDTQRSGIAGDLFVVLIQGGAWPVNEVIRISGPVDELARGGRPRTP